MGLPRRVVVALLAATCLSEVQSLKGPFLDDNAVGEIKLARRQRKHKLLSSRTLEWIQNKTEWLSVPNVKGYPNLMDITGIVTHSGKNAVEYIDTTVMLGLALQRLVPEYPRFAIAVEGMNPQFQDQLKAAGWNLIMVEDWADDHACKGGCAGDFLGRWGDSFEKVNVFRLPIGRILFLDSDTYIWNDQIREVLNMNITGAQMAMAPDGCKPEHNSGVMLFNSRLRHFSNLMTEIAAHSGGREVLDQTIINIEYHDSIVTIDKKFNCIDYSSDKRCSLDCDVGTVISHFTGRPKPTRAEKFLQPMVRDQAKALEYCRGTNRGNCKFWQNYYCDMKINQRYLTPWLQRALNQSGDCLAKPSFEPPASL